MNVIDFNEDEELQLKTEIENARQSLEFDEEITKKPSKKKSKKEVFEDDEDEDTMVSGKEVVKEIISIIINVAICIGLVFLITHYVGQRTVVSGTSMEDTLSNGDNLIVDRISYRFKDPERFDVIVFPYQYEEGTYYIKRIIGLPGESVYIDSDGIIYINNKVLDESYGTEVILNPGLASEEIILGEDEYFVLGDNRNNSTDSRFESVQNIKGEDIVGKAWVRIFPFTEIGFVDNIE